MDEMILRICSRLDTESLESILAYCLWLRTHFKGQTAHDGYRDGILSMIAATVPLLPQNGQENVYDLAVQHNR